MSDEDPRDLLANAILISQPLGTVSTINPSNPRTASATQYLDLKRQAPGPVVMLAPQNVAPPQHRPVPATGPASNSAATRNFAPRPTTCFRCGQGGHLRQNCPTAGAVPRPAASQATVVPPDRVQMASDGKNLRDVYMPIQLFGHRGVTLLDSGCEKSIIGARLLPDGVEVRPTTRTLLAASGTSIPLEGECDVHFKVAGRKFNICAVVTKSMHEFILGIDFLPKNVSAWDFGTGHICVRNLWVRLHRCSTKQEHRYVLMVIRVLLLHPVLKLMSL